MKATLHLYEVLCFPFREYFPVQVSRPRTVYVTLTRPFFSFFLRRYRPLYFKRFRSYKFSSPGQHGPTSFPSQPLPRRPSPFFLPRFNIFQNTLGFLKQNIFNRDSSTTSKYSRIRPYPLSLVRN